MSYATQQDLIDRFGEQELIELTDRADPPTGEIDATVVSKRIADADAIIDSYLGGRYKFPLSSVPEILVGISCAIARKKLYADAPLDEVISDDKDAMRMLRDISSGVAKLEVEGVESAANTTGAPVLNSAPQTFNKNTMKGF